MLAYADIKLGYSCNNNCIHCVISNQRKNAISKRGNQNRSTEEYKKELFDSKRNGYSSVVFTGGEPTLRSDLFELLNYAKSLNYRIHMQTNGRLFCYDEFSKKISKYSISYTIALHGHLKEIHDKITRTPNSFEQTIKGIKNLIKNKQIVSGKVVISKKNYKNLKEINEVFISLGVKKVNIAFPHAQGNAMKYFDIVVPTYTEIKKYVYDSIEHVKKYNIEKQENINVDFEAIPFCFMEGYEEYVGEINFNDSDNIELKQLDGESADWTVIRKTIKSKFPQCKKCNKNQICEGPWKEYAEKYGYSEFKEII